MKKTGPERRRRILIVEDNEKNMYLMSFILTNSGHEIVKCCTGEEAVEIAVKEKPDMVIMDIQLPGIDGLEATRRIRASEGGGNLPIVAVTSYAMTGDKEGVMAAGCNGYIEKPINPETFIAEIQKYFK
ncbi:MAG: response regulator [Bacteroidota bacterium]|jgi:CheY-like chemotaxis protein